MNFFVKDYANNIAPNFRGFALSDPMNDGPLDGYYWEVFHLSVWDSDNNGQNLALYLFDGLQLTTLNAAITAGANQGYIPDFSAILGGLPIAGMHKLAPGQGAASASQWGLFQSQRTGGGTINHNGGLPKIYIPSRWGLYLVETNGVVSALSRTLQMRFAYRQFKNGCSPDSGW